MSNNVTPNTSPEKEQVLSAPVLPLFIPTSPNRTVLPVGGKRTASAHCQALGFSQVLVDTSYSYNSGGSSGGDAVVISDTSQVIPAADNIIAVEAHNAASMSSPVNSVKSATGPGSGRGTPKGGSGPPSPTGQVVPKVNGIETGKCLNFLLPLSRIYFIRRSPTLR